MSVLLILILLVLSGLDHGLVSSDSVIAPASLTVDASPGKERKIPDTLFGIFFEEINHAGTGGLWAELVSNRGFEAGRGGESIEPWSVIGDGRNVDVATDRSSPFVRNKVALKMSVLCSGDHGSNNSCPNSGVGIYNPGFWGMNIEDKNRYNVILYMKSSRNLNVTASLTSADGSTVLSSTTITSGGSKVESEWAEFKFTLVSNGTDHNSRFQLTTTDNGIVWFDQISVMPDDTYNGHGFRKDLYSMLADLKPRFIRFPGGCFVEGDWLKNAFRWKETVGPWEERPGHFGDVWNYWTDDGLGYYEFLQLAEDLGAAPVWVINNGISHHDEISPLNLSTYVQDFLDSIEFARGNSSSKWGSVRAAMGHPETFNLEYVAIGNEDCEKEYYQANYVIFYKALKAAYPDIRLVSNCDASSHPIHHKADLYDYHIYTNAKTMFLRANHFDNAPRSGPKGFVSEYAVTEPHKDVGNGTFLAALGEAGFLIGLERNSDLIEMACYAPLFVNTNDRRWSPDAIVYNSWQQYGTPSYWVQHFFIHSSGATYHPVKLESIDSNFIAVASAITWKQSEDGRSFLKIKVANFGDKDLNLDINVVGLSNHGVRSSGSMQTTFKGELTAENSFDDPKKVIPVASRIENAGKKMYIKVSSRSLTSFDLPLIGPSIQI
ncbi:Arabinoxylan arabinofuranohydrolase, family GH51 [Zostera marina]|uniref:non-reducing end alpha-L-arabinofuranosidase n=1 Tax=Zostera marina TaxID=29655 RepID=A0A0K9PRZ3_ZOSMR|nr:Arabinoxylan arabinofuranohydrolase, family GH51 [Zostera marina]